MGHALLHAHRQMSALTQKLQEADEFRQEFSSLEIKVRLPQSVHVSYARCHRLNSVTCLTEHDMMHHHASCTSSLKREQPCRKSNFESALCNFNCHTFGLSASNNQEHSCVKCSDEHACHILHHHHHHHHHLTTFANTTCFYYLKCVGFATSAPHS